MLIWNKITIAIAMTWALVTPCPPFPLSMTIGVKSDVKGFSHRGPYPCWLGYPLGLIQVYERSRRNCRGTRAVKGAGLKLRWQGLRGFKSHPLHQLFPYPLCLILTMVHPRSLSNPITSIFVRDTVAARAASGFSTRSRTLFAMVSCSSALDSDKTA